MTPTRQELFTRRPELTETTTIWSDGEILRTDWRGVTTQRPRMTPDRGQKRAGPVMEMETVEL